ncbi:MAG: prepilin peptidase [Gammaproteobacteria bacterium]|nr:prepilin peptidase [Gammaproteobacteria bacterium]
MQLLDVFRHSPALFLLAVVLFGLLVGSFLNVVIHRLPRMLHRRFKSECLGYFTEHQPEWLSANSAHLVLANEKFNLVVPRSRCPRCGHMITALENIPVISYLLLRGRCAQCHDKISWRYPLVESLSALLAAVVAWKYGVTALTGFGLLLTFALLALTFIDYDTQYLPDEITLPFIWLGLLINRQEIFTDLASALWGAVAGYLLLWFVYQVFKLITRKEGMGFGDFKLLALLGAWLGWQVLPAIVIISSLIGSIVGISLIVLRRHDRHKPIPFGPYLAGAGWINLVWGNAIQNFYFHSILGMP